MGLFANLLIRLCDFKNRKLLSRHCLGVKKAVFFIVIGVRDNR